jgi:hypothetical protein
VAPDERFRDRERLTLSDGSGVLIANDYWGSYVYDIGSNDIIDYEVHYINEVKSRELYYERRH